MAIIRIDELTLKVYEKSHVLRNHAEPAVKELAALSKDLALATELLLEAALDSEIEKTVTEVEVAVHRRRALSIEEKLTEARHKLGRMERGMKVNSLN